MREPQRIKLLQKGVGKAQKASSRIKYKCLLPSCTKHGIRSHSQQKKHQLSSIAENLEVVSVEKNIYKSFSLSLKDDFNIFQSKPIGQASTFIGYCNTHDKEIFKPVENGNLNINLEEHNLLLFLRSFSYEYSNKRSAYDRSKVIYKECSDLFNRQGARGYQNHIDGMRFFLEIDAPYYLTKLFESYENKDYSQISYNSFTIPKNIGVSATTCFSPLQGSHSEWMLNNFEKVQPTVALSIVPDHDKTSVSFAWLSKFDHMCSNFMAINLETENLSNLLNSYVINESEDLCIRPSIWEGLSESDKKILNKLMSKMEDSGDLLDMPQVINI